MKLLSSHIESSTTKRIQKKESNRSTCFDELGIVGLFAADLARVSGLEARSGELSLLPVLKRAKYESQLNLM